MLFEQPTKLELVLNSNIAKTLGFAMPQSILGRNEKVIE